jgi:predicted component of type VI protein secretion system
MEWPLSLDIVLGLLTPSSVVVPGHGAVVDREFVEEQRNTIGIVAETIRDLATRGVPLAEALEAGDWPYPSEHLANAVRRGYEHLPRSQKRLPLV